MSVEYARRGLIGVLTPQANTTVEPELHFLWPPGFAMINARLTSSMDTIEGRLVDYWNNAERELKQFANAPVQAVSFACTGTSYLAGKDDEDALVARAKKDHGLPFITSAKAVTDALNVLGAKNIGLVSPYPASLSKKSVLYWQSRGFTIGELSSVANDDSQFHPIYSMSAGSADGALQQLRTKPLDAIIMLGTGMPTLSPIANAARWDGPPVMSCMLCLAWRTIEAVTGDHLKKETLLHWIEGETWAARLRTGMDISHPAY